MRRSNWVVRQIAACLALLMIVSSGEPGTAQAQQAAAVRHAQGDSSAIVASPEKPDPGTTSSYPDAPDAQSSQQEPPQASPEPQQGDGAKPVGTAAAPYERPTGITGSRPAGAVIAPAKQRRVRTILISIGVVAAAGIAIGTVAGLSHGSPSRPN
jgi:hypothetical protein